MLRIIVAVLALGFGAGTALADSFSEDESCSTVTPRFGNAAPYQVCEGTSDGFQYSWTGGRGTLFKTQVVVEAGRLGPELDKVLAQNRTDKVEVMCGVDPMTDVKSCVLTNRNGGGRDTLPAVSFFIVGYGPKGEGRLCVGGDHYPGSQIRVRLDKGEPIVRSERDGCFPPAIVRRLLQANDVVTQHMEWPYQTWVTQKGDTKGLTQAMKLADFLLARL